MLPQQIPLSSFGGGQVRSNPISIGHGNRWLFVQFADPDPFDVTHNAPFTGGYRFLLHRAVAHMLEVFILKG
jgi:hypothetical protein